MGPQGIGLEPGDVIDGRFRIDALLGEGGFGAVFRATQLNLDRKVAIKVVLPQLLSTPALLERFLREAQVAQRLEHPNTVRMYDFGRTEHDVPYIAWELLKGRPLDEILKQDGALTIERVVRISTQVLKALMEAHSLGIVHRDIKPANIFLSDFQGEPDFVKVLDFGIAKALDTAEGQDGKNLTVAGQIIGTPNYMAPEQVEGRDVGPTADLYSLGLVMAEMLTGRAVLQGTGLAVCAAHLSPEPLPIDQAVLGSMLGPVISRATQKRPEHRYAGAREMLDDLREVARSGGLDTGLIRGAGSASQPGFPDTSSYPGAHFAASPTTPAPVTPASMNSPAQAEAGGQSRVLLVLLGVLGTLVVVGGLLLIVLSVYLFGGEDEPSPRSSVVETPGGGVGRAHSTGGASRVPGPGEPFVSGATEPPISGNLDVVTVDMLSRRIQAAGFRLLQQPTIQDSGVVRTVVVVALRGQSSATIMLYDYDIPMGIESLASTLQAQAGAVRHNGRRLLYVRVMGSAPPDASEQVLQYLLR